MRHGVPLTQASLIVLTPVVMGSENKFAVHEHWHSMDDIEAHFKEKHFTDFAEELQQYLAGPSALSIGKYHSVSSRSWFCSRFEIADPLSVLDFMKALTSWDTLYLQLIKILSR